MGVKHRWNPQENDSDWLIFEGYLTNGVHTITLTMDDGINAPVEASVIVEVASSAPVLNLESPDLEQGYHSSDLIEFDLRNSVDYDGDNFTFNLTSDISGVIMTDSNPLEIHGINLVAGQHSLTFTLTDETGLSRQETVSLQVVESDPEAVIYEPINNQFFEPGELIILDSNGTNDADNNSFLISGTTLLTSTTLDFETKNSYNIYINVNDGANNYAKAFTAVSYTHLTLPTKG